MTRFDRWTVFAAIVIASIWTFGPRSAGAQSTASPKSPPPEKVQVTVVTRDSVTAEDVQKAAEQLTIAVQEAVRKATEDPAVKIAALKVAKSAVTAAQVVITQQAETLQAVLDALAKEIAQATVKQQTKARSH
ncbi:MAG: hypothetical protein ABI681_11040 [Gemmatimonadales bacterium]